MKAIQRMTLRPNYLPSVQTCLELEEFHSYTSLINTIVGGIFLSLLTWYLGSQDRDLTLGLEHGPKAIGEVWKVQVASNKDYNKAPKIPPAKISYPKGWPTTISA